MVLETEIGFFGKLPFHQDFIQVNAAFPEMYQLDEWFQEGIQLMRRHADVAWPSDFENGGPWEFLYYPPGSQRCLIGLYSPSRDQGGRHYPFFVFRSLARTIPAWPLFLAPLAFAEFLEAAYLFGKTDWRECTIQLLKQRLDQMPIGAMDLPGCQECYENFLTRQTTEGLWTDLFGQFEDARKYVFYRNLVRILEPLRNYSITQLAIGLLFPLLPYDKSQNFDIAFWLDLIQRLLRQELGGAICFWKRRGRKQQSHLFVHLGKPSAKTLLWLIRPDVESDVNYDLAPATDESPSRVLLRVGHSQRKLLQTADLSLSTFLSVVEVL